MKLIIPTIGSRGDVQPFIALAQGLIQAGHYPVVASHPCMRELVESYGVSFEPIGPDINLAERVAEIRQRAKNPAVGLIKAMGFGFEMLERSHEDILTLCRSADIVIVPSAVAAGKNEAELLSLPYLSVTFMPWGIPWDDPDRPIFKRVLYHMIDELVGVITTQPLNRIRKRLSLPPAGKDGFTSEVLNLIPISPHVFKPNPLWEPHHHLTGYWITEGPANWSPPSDLQEFLQDGDPPIAITLGAMSLGLAGAIDTVRLFLDAIRETGCRAIIQGWDETLKEVELPKTVFAAGALPHNWLFPQCKGIIHHGGFGTTSSCLHAGIPSLIIPHIGDQFYWGDQVCKMDVGVKPIRRERVKRSSLIESIIELTTNAEIRGHANMLGEKIRLEDGVSTAVRLIEKTFVI